MTANNPTIGGKGKRATDAPSKLLHGELTCPTCGKVSAVQFMTRDNWYLWKPCTCGAIIRVYAEGGIIRASIEEVV